MVAFDFRNKQEVNIFRCNENVLKKRESVLFILASDCHHKLQPNVNLDK